MDGSNPRVFFELKQGSRRLGRMVMVSPASSPASFHRMYGMMFAHSVWEQRG